MARGAMMDPIYFIIFLSMAAGFAREIFRRKKTYRESRAGWIGLLIIASILLGMSLSENETLIWLFGFMLLATIPAMLFWALGSAAGKLLKRKH